MLAVFCVKIAALMLKSMLPNEIWTTFYVYSKTLMVFYLHKEQLTFPRTYCITRTILPNSGIYQQLAVILLYAMKTKSLIL